MGRRIGVTGGRDFTDQHIIEWNLSAVLHRGDVFVHGDARGVDRIAARVAHMMGCVLEPHRADWNNPAYVALNGSKIAGHIRNQAMCDSGLDLLIAFPGGSGTRSMMDKAEAAGIPIHLADVECGNGDFKN